MKILLIGATGVIGQAVLPLLREYVVIGTTRSSAKRSLIEQYGATAMVVDVYNREAVMALVASTKPDIILYQVTDLADVDVAANARLRQVATKHVVDAAIAHNVKRMIAQSVAFAYGEGSGLAKEDDALHTNALQPRKISIEAIATLEQEIQRMSEFVILRNGLLYGRGTWYDEHLLPHKSEQQEATSGIVSFIHIEDAARAIVAALYWPTTIVNIVDDEPISWAEWKRTLTGQERVVRRGEYYERGASNDRLYALGFTLKYPTWRTEMISKKICATSRRVIPHLE